MVTPSFVIVGAPNFLSMTTFRPRGPSVTRTVLASLSTPRWSASRAAESNCSCFAMDLCSSLPEPVGTIPERVLIRLNLPDGPGPRNPPLLGQDPEAVEGQVGVHFLDGLGVLRDHGSQAPGRDHGGLDLLFRRDPPDDRVHLAHRAVIDAGLKALLGAPPHHALGRM